MKNKRNSPKKELSANERNILNTIQKDVIHHYYSPALESGTFEILSTLRYDPSFTHIFSGELSRTPEERHKRVLEDQSNGDASVKLNEIDDRLKSMNYDDNNLFTVSDIDDHGKFAKFDDYMDNFDENSGKSVEEGNLSLLSLMHECLGTQDSSPPKSPALTEVDLLPTFYQRFLLLGEHFKRLNFSLEFFKWGFHVPINLLLENLIRAIPDHHEVTDLQEKMRLLITTRSCYKMRVLISNSGKMRVEAHPLSSPDPSNYFFSTTQYFIDTILSGFMPNSPSTWDIFVDLESTRISPFTTFKTTFRDQYNAARERLTQIADKYGRTNKREILVYNDAYQLLEGSISSVAVIKHKEEDLNQFRFITPPLASGCLCGTMRRYLLKKGLIDEYPIDIRDLQEGEDVLLMNGVMGCVKGTIRQAFQHNT
ncbi:ABZ2 (YMR289W) [Zygosaccharomyces parabailii]|nr:ABZ2 (YMR289W) [Zygosaccharomyces parabailii]CDH10750.1 uncharacterized protein ZBAI_02536 [Zygosaccharomyces bailii ISA1307]